VGREFSRGLQKRSGYKRFKITVEVLPDKLFNRLYGVGDNALWDGATNTISLRASRHDPARYTDWLHECRHAYTDHLCPGED